MERSLPVLYVYAYETIATIRNASQRLERNAIGIPASRLVPSATT